MNRGARAALAIALVIATPGVCTAGVISHDSEIWCANGVVDEEDVATVLAAFGPCSGCVEDLNDNGQVGETDLRIVLAHWGECVSACDVDGNGLENLADLRQIQAASGLDCRADLDRNRQIDARDAGLAELEWTRIGNSADEHAEAVGAVNDDPALTVLDVLLVYQAIGTNCRPDIDQDGTVDWQDEEFFCAVATGIPGISVADCEDELRP